MAFTEVGTISVGPTDREVLVGTFSLDEGDDTLFLRVTQTSPAEKWNYSYGLVTFRTAVGQELGTTKVYGSVYGENFRLGVGLPPLVGTGNIFFTPRAYNRAWITIADPPKWNLELEAQSGRTAGGGGSGSDGGAFGGLLSDAAGALLTYAFREGFAYLLIP